MFPVFLPQTTWNANLAESGNSGWKCKHPLALVDAAMDDVSEVICMEKKYEQYIANETLTTLGRGLTPQSAAAKD